VLIWFTPRCESTVVRVAVIGAGVSGLGAAHVLSRAHDVTLFERERNLGGHVRTLRHRGLALDTGFLVHNGPNYPLLTRLFTELGVDVQETEMSFSVTCGDCGLEWSGRRPFAQPRRVLDPGFLGMLREVGRWLRTAGTSLDDADDERRTLEEYVTEHRYSRRFRAHFLVPLTSALWSTAPERALDFPAAYAIRFFERHGMLGFRRFRWRSVVGGADTYVTALRERLRGDVRAGVAVRSLRRSPDGVRVQSADGSESGFDKVVVATRADEALRLLEDASGTERRLLGAWQSTRNEVVLHTDERLLPRAHAARASWNYHVNGSVKPSITYYLNRLQRLEADEHWCVTLNRTEAIHPERVVDRAVLEHPLYTTESLASQRGLAELSGERHTYYAGAYLGNGFHEDGLASGVRAAAALGVDW
jgi:predicted NAD/FAD-binding protein